MIVVVGAGIAGLCAALAAAGDSRLGSEGLSVGGRASIPKNGTYRQQEVLLVCKDKFVESNTYHAQGGVATAIFNDDSPALHATDTMAAGHGLCDRTAVDILTDEGARRVRELIGDGWHVDRDGEGHVLRGLEAAHCRSRVVHAGGDATGKVLELDVSAMVRENPNITVLEHAFLNDVLVRDGHVTGVRLAVRDAQDGVETRVVDTDRVVLATGGAGRLFPYTTNPAVATGDGLAAAIRAGAQVADLEFYQFHPTALAIGEHFLVSEAVRGEGAVLLDEHGRRFMADIDPKAELAPRDVVARANFRTMQAQGGKPIMLDVSPMGKENPDLAEFLRHRFPTIDAYTRSLGFDWSKEFPWLPRPTIGWAASALTCSDEPASPASMRPANAPELVCRVPIVSHRTRCLKAWSTDIAPALPLRMTPTVPFGNRRISTTARSKTCRSASSRCCCICRMPQRSRMLRNR